MPWQPIDPRYLRQAEPDGLTLAYVGHGELDTGHLLLHLDSGHEIVGFELSYDRFLGACELYAAWSRTGGLRLGEVDSGDRRGASAPRPEMSLLVHYHRRPATADLAAMLAYVERSSGPLTPQHHQVVVAVLRAALHESES